MKFRWVPWYSATFEIDETQGEFLKRVMVAVRDYDWQQFDNDYIGHVDDNSFRIFFRRFSSKIISFPFKELQASYSTILLGFIRENGDNHRIKIIISLYWQAYLVLIPFFVIPIFESINSKEPLLLLFSLAVYSLTVVFYNIRAHILYNLFLKILHNKLNLY